MPPPYIRSPHLILPFLCPPLILRPSAPQSQKLVSGFLQTRHHITETPSIDKSTRLNPAPEDFSAPSFVDSAKLELFAGAGGSGCIAFLKEAFIEQGPANGGDGGHGGNIYIEAVHGETSLHKLARRRTVRAGVGRGGQGKNKTGRRGEDVIITVPVGTVVREIERYDPVVEEKLLARAMRRQKKLALSVEVEDTPASEENQSEQGLAEDDFPNEDGSEARNDQPDSAPSSFDEAFRSRRVDDGFRRKWTDRSRKRSDEGSSSSEPTMLASEDPFRHKWVLYPGLSSTEAKNIELPRLPTRQVLFAPPKPPVELDLSRPTPRPILLATGGVGGLGNPHFVSGDLPRPMFATRGEPAMMMTITLELKLLADVGLVGLPNAGKSTLLRAMTNSRARVGAWAFTTLKPNIGTVVLDNNKGRPVVYSTTRRPRENRELPYGWWTDEDDTEVVQRTRFTIADIPGLIEGAHLDKGLGMAFLRHVERAGVLAFVVDLSAGNAVKALDSLWREVGMYAQFREDEEKERERDARIQWDDQGDDAGRGGTVLMADYPVTRRSESRPALHIAAKPWFVVATKGDLPDTQQNFEELQEYLARISRGEAPHPSGVEGAWTKDCAAIPVSAINGHGIDRIVHWVVGLLDD